MSDLISRQTAIEEIARWKGYLDDDMIFRIQTGIKRLPTALRSEGDGGIARIADRKWRKRNECTRNVR